MKNKFIRNINNNISPNTIPFTYNGNDVMLNDNLFFEFDARNFTTQILIESLPISTIFTAFTKLYNNHILMNVYDTNSNYLYDVIIKLEKNKIKIYYTKNNNTVILGIIHN